MKKCNALCGLVASSALFVSINASAVIIDDTPPDTPPPGTPPPSSVLSLDAGWYGSCYFSVGAGAAGPGCGLDAGDAINSMSLVLTDPALLKVTAMAAGDIYDVYINSVFSFTTSAPTLIGPFYALDPDVAFASTDFGSESIILGAGSYSIDIFAAALSPAGLGVSAIEVQSIPVPAAVWLFGSGLIGLIGIARK